MGNIKRVTSRDTKDIEMICKLADEIWKQHFTAIISEAQIEYMLDRFQSKEAIEKQLNEEGYVYYIAYMGDEPVGYIGVVPKSSERAIFLSKLYVKKSFRKNGIAKALLSEACKDYPKETYQKIYLTCNKKNEGSILAYLKMGFAITDSKVTPIGNDMVMDDYILALKR